MILKQWKALRKARKEYEETITRLTSEVEFTRNQLDLAYGGLDRQQKALDDIIALVKPTSNATVKRAARIAAEGKAF